MNKYLLMSAAAAMASTASVAQAATTISPGSYCDYWVVNQAGVTMGGGFYAARHVGAQSCLSTTYVDELGFGAKNPHAKKKGGVGFSDGTLTVLEQAPLFILFSTPFKTGGTWELILSETGSTAYIFNSGTYKLGKPNGSRTMLSDMIKALRAGK